MIKVTDMIAAVAEEHRPRYSTTDVVVHRIALQGVAHENLDAYKLAAAFRNRSADAPGAVTGGQVPYHFLLRPTGEVQQLLEADAKGAHTAGLNNCSIAVALAGDFRKMPPTWGQAKALDEMLTCWVALGLKVSRHDAHRQGKVCPGPFLPLEAMLDHIAKRLELAPISAPAALERLRLMGVK